MPAALRELFITIILFCMPSNPQELFDKHHLEWSDDFKFEALKRSLVLSESQLKTKVLLDISHRLNARDRNLQNFRIKEPTEDELKEIEIFEIDNYPVLIREELDFDVFQLIRYVEEKESSLYNAQRNVFELVMQAVSQESLCMSLLTPGVARVKHFFRILS